MERKEKEEKEEKKKTEEDTKRKEEEIRKQEEVEALRKKVEELSKEKEAAQNPEKKTKQEDMRVSDPFTHPERRVLMAEARKRPRETGKDEVSEEKRQRQTTRNPQEKSHG